MIVYADTSALVKLFVEEAVSDALRDFLAGEIRVTASALVRVEVLRALARRGERGDEERAESYLDALTLIALEHAVLDRAARLAPGNLRTRDALHLATALALSPLPARFLCYDRRLAEAARDHGLRVIAPGADEGRGPRSAGAL